MEEIKKVYEELLKVAKEVREHLEGGIVEPKGKTFTLKEQTEYVRGRLTDAIHEVERVEKQEENPEELSEVDLFQYDRKYEDDACGEEVPCIICGKAIDEGKGEWVKLNETLRYIIDPNSKREQDGGCHKIGSGCIRKHKLQKYVIK